MVTTVKIQEQTKSALDEFKDNNESYDAAIKKLIEHVKSKDLKKRLIEGYRAMGAEDLKSVEEWEIASSELE